jgi:protein-S-isoprenylcysteine O-methyltransferase Ste14
MPFHTAIYRSLEVAWVIFLLVWLVAAFSASRAIKRQSWWSRVLTIAVGAVPYYLLFTNRLRYGPLARRFVPDDSWVLVTGVVLTYAGIALAIWARIVLGKNWSAMVTIKEGHRLVRTGPYSAVRHPIYSGLLLAVLGTALVVGEVRGLVAAVIGFTAWLVKSRTEEGFLMKEFGPEYEEYRRHTRALVPFIL